MTGLAAKRAASHVPDELVNDPELLKETSVVSW